VGGSHTCISKHKIFRYVFRQPSNLERTHKKHKHIDLKIKDIYWLIGRNSKLSLENKMLPDKTNLDIWSGNFGDAPAKPIFP
jgi:hypothetical protein